MTDFYISAIKYSKEEPHIEYVLVHQTYIEDRVTKLGRGYPVHRAFVAMLIRDKKLSFKTVLLSKDRADAGTDVNVFDDIYLKTANNQTEKDNLENLPVFEDFEVTEP